MYKTVTEDYLDGRGGSSEAFRMYLQQGQRIGQAFFNALGPADQEILRSTAQDPFYESGQALIHLAIEFLLDNEGSNNV